MSDFQHTHEHHQRENPGGPSGLLQHGSHSHTHLAAAVDPALATERGIWALKISLAALLLTVLFQAGVVLRSGSVGLLADTIHNFSDALTAIPLGLAFLLGRLAPNRRYTYGYGRAEDLAGMVIVLLILFSALEVFYQSYLKIVHPTPVANLGWVALAAGIGFLGNEFVAIFRLRVGRQIGSAALTADGLHAQVDGFTSLGVLVGVLGVWAGFPLADPLVGLAIGASILVVTWKAAGEMGYRTMDAIDPQVSEKIEQCAASVTGVLGVQQVRARWLGHRQHSELVIFVDGQLSTSQSHAIGETVRQALLQALPAMQEITIQIQPQKQPVASEHDLTGQ